MKRKPIAKIINLTQRPSKKFQAEYIEYEKYCRDNNLPFIVIEAARRQFTVSLDMGYTDYPLSKTGVAHINALATANAYYVWRRHPRASCYLSGSGANTPSVTCLTMELAQMTAEAVALIVSMHWEKKAGAFH